VIGLDGESEGGDCDEVILESKMRGWNEKKSRLSAINKTNK